MEREEDISPEAREQQFQHVLAGEAVKTYEALQEHEDHFMLLPDEVLGNRIGWTFQPAKDVEVVGRLEACRRALLHHGADIQSLSIIEVRVDVPTEGGEVQAQLEPRAVLLVYKPSAEVIQRRIEETGFARPT